VNEKQKNAKTILVERVLHAAAQCLLMRATWVSFLAVLLCLMMLQADSIHHQSPPPPRTTTISV
jgi:hypothetical protein